ncbi:MAG: hypothetical protein WKG00_23175 [Polyangiaceae bacterium]
MRGWERLAVLGVGAVLVRLAACSDGDGVLGDDPEVNAGEPQVVALSCSAEYTVTADFGDGTQEVRKSYYAEADLPGFDPATSRSFSILVCGRERWDGGAWVPATPNGTFCPDGATCTGQTPARYPCEMLHEGDDVTLQAGKVQVDCGGSFEPADGDASGGRWTQVYVSYQ